MARAVTTTRSFLAEHGDVLLTAGVMGILVALIVPLPTPVLDILLTFNFSYVLLLLIVTLTLKSPLELSTFPSLLLFGTLFRLALNVAATRLVLLHAYAGTVIESFGQFVVGGEMVVGLVIFFILVVIQFVVITKGAERISEVAARFTLDAMPGKQMSIDADLNAGLITVDEAKRRRENIVREADFYGAMDGASKYVRGDAIAGIIIVLINLVGGIIIGLTKHMSVGEALNTYALLTIGDGLVTQIPAVIMSTSAGILITKSASEKGLSRELAAQVFGNPRAIIIAAVIIMGFVLVPGLPSIPFLLLGLFLIAVYMAVRERRKVPAAKEARPAQEATEKKDSEDLIIRSVLQPDRIAVEVGYNLIQLIDPQKGGTLLERIKALRKKFAQEFGVVLPKIRILDNVELNANRYVIRLAGHKVAEGELYPARVMAMKPDGAPAGVEGIKTTEPSFGLPVVWVMKPERERAEAQGCTVVDADSVFITHLSEVLRRHVHEILNRQDVQQLLDNVKVENPAAIEQLVPDVITPALLQQVLENLLAEGIPINNLTHIIEKCGNYAPQVKDPFTLTELVRKSMGRTVCSRFLDAEGNLNLISLDPQLEEEIRESLAKTEGKATSNLSPSRLRQIMDGILEQTSRAFKAGTQAAIVTDSQIRPYVRGIVSRVCPEVPVISYDEIIANVSMKNVGMITPSEKVPSQRAAPTGFGLAAVVNA